MRVNDVSEWVSLYLAFDILSTLNNLQKTEVTKIKVCYTIFFSMTNAFEGGYKGTFDYLQLQIRVKYKVGCIFMLITK